MEQLTPFELKVAEILGKKLADVGINPSDDLTMDEIAQVEELTKDAQDEARELE